MLPPDSGERKLIDSHPCQLRYDHWLAENRQAPS